MTDGEWLWWVFMGKAGFPDCMVYLGQSTAYSWNGGLGVFKMSLERTYPGTLYSLGPQVSPDSCSSIHILPPLCQYLWHILPSEVNFLNNYLWSRVEGSGPASWWACAPQQLASPSFSLDLGSSHQWPVPSSLCHLLCAGFLHPQVWTPLRTSGDHRT